MSRNLKMLPVTCAQCGAQLEADTTKETMVCPYCGTSFLIQKDNTPDGGESSGTDSNMKSILSFIGQQMAERRKYKVESK